MANNSLLGTDSLPDIPPTSDEKTMALLSHVLTIVLPLIAPLVIYLVKKDESSFVAAHAKESLNFQITLIPAFFVAFLLIFVLIGFLLIIALGLFATIWVIVATIKASEGKLYRYPLCLRLIS